MTYTEAVELLIKDSASGAVLAARGAEFENSVEWGCDLASEHERYIAEVVFKKPTIVYNYPKEIKAFYMRLNDDNKTVAAMDVLVPRVVRIHVLCTRRHANDMAVIEHWAAHTLRRSARSGRGLSWGVSCVLHLLNPGYSLRGAWHTPSSLQGSTRGWRACPQPTRPAGLPHMRPYEEG